jgi:hypothetical protein
MFWLQKEEEQGIKTSVEKLHRVVTFKTMAKMKNIKII